MMAGNVDAACDQHSDPFECHDRLLYYNAVFDEHGLIVHDGGSSYVVITHCPWCGNKLPDSKRDRWFKELEAKGFDDPVHQQIPSEYESDEWYKSQEG